MLYQLVDPRTAPGLRRLLHVLGATATAILVIGVLVLVVSIFELASLIRDTQVDRTQVTEDTATAAEEAARSANRIEDCTTPGRECFEASQQRTAEAVGLLNTYAIAAAACADQPETQTVAEIEACIREVVGDPKR